MMGIASCLKHLKPKVKAYACEVDVAAPLHTSLRKGGPTSTVEGTKFNVRKFRVQKISQILRITPQFAKLNSRQKNPLA